MRTCTRCGEAKSLDEFGKRGKIRHSWCRECCRAYNREWYNSPKANEKQVLKRRAANAEKRERNREFVRDYLSKHPCECGESRVPVLEFHHLDPSNKKYEVSTMMQRGHAIEKIMIEIEKCKVVCANCHKMLHFEEREDTHVVEL